MTTKKLDDMVFIHDLMKVVVENLRNGVTCTRLVADAAQTELELTVTKLGGKSLPNTRGPS